MRRLLLLSLMATACAVAGQPEPPAPPTPTPALVSSPIVGPCSMRNEAFAGVTEVDYSYEAGRRVRAVEHGPAGERQMLWSYDEHGRRAKEVVIDGASIRTRSFHYDARNLLVRTDVTQGADTQVLEQHRRSYDDEGLLRTRAEAHWVEGAWVTVDHHALHYDDQGRFVYELRTRSPIEGPETIHSITVNVDARGRVTARRVDEGMDGTFEQVSLFAFDDEGRLVTTTQMKGNAIKDVARHTYDAQGRLVRTTLEDGTGAPLGTTTYDFSCWS